MPNALSDEDKMKCTIRWLNTLYTAWVKEERAAIPCGKCKHYPKECNENVPTPTNFKILEQFAGEGTVVSTLIG